MTASGEPKLAFLVLRGVLTVAAFGSLIALLMGAVGSTLTSADSRILRTLCIVIMFVALPIRGSLLFRFSLCVIFFFIFFVAWAVLRALHVT